MESDTNMALINSSEWSMTSPINMQSKANLLQCLIWDEVVGKRDTSFQKRFDELWHIRTIGYSSDANRGTVCALEFSNNP